MPCVKNAHCCGSKHKHCAFQFQGRVSTLPYFVVVLHMRSSYLAGLLILIVLCISKGRVLQLFCTLHNSLYCSALPHVMWTSILSLLPCPSLSDLWHVYYVLGGWIFVCCHFLIICPVSHWPLKLQSRLKQKPVNLSFTGMQKKFELAYVWINENVTRIWPQPALLDRNCQPFVSKRSPSQFTVTVTIRRPLLCENSWELWN